MKEKEKLINILKEIYDVFKCYLSTSELFFMVNGEGNFVTGVSKNQISSALHKNTKFSRVKKGNEVYYYVEEWLV